MQQAIPFTTTNLRHGAIMSKDRPQLTKRKFVFSSCSNNDTEIVTKNKKQRKEKNSTKDNITGSDQVDIFEWMDNILRKGIDETHFTIPPITSSSANEDEIIAIDSNPEHREENVTIDSSPEYQNEDTVIDSLLSLNESDTCYEEMISLLAQDDKNDNDKENDVFKEIHESFVADRLLQHNPLSSKQKKKSTVVVNSRRARSSRIGLREGLDQLVKANKQSEQTRRWLLKYKPTWCGDNNQ
mmetsp:Transcript_28717/g.61629  ORF Transcript_28717/g.61629 Transcript_28717/m.61629 type:complete len:241 (-) Transcript_28717:138-860(-)|eukprot:CAMPEP_0201123736 /NCGR_PEP_ID=MMETSP0850-20130426/9060_1 /ASSEMBLY_ACC=CAM_ASM_000622 /TAXON_ID=183588 /ORGANISM="Pseudo-nitzschia fraudulenta, Strain WWA7" /LENGTH=240 /DNA_ID=CAMNT_0047390803 /DNA_START=43 /DNA_END=765 /DNA_ORIENTATION=-